MPLGRPIASESPDENWRQEQQHRMQLLRDRTFRQTVPLNDPLRYRVGFHGQTPHMLMRTLHFESEPGVEITIHLGLPRKAREPWPLVVAPLLATDERAMFLTGGCIRGISWVRCGRAIVEVRGTGNSSPGPGLLRFVRRGYALLGQSLPERQAFDLLAALRVLAEIGHDIPDMQESFVLYGHGAMAPVSAYAALLSQDTTRLILDQPVATHLGDCAEFLNILQVGDFVDNLALLAPMPIDFVEQLPESFRRLQSRYAQLGHAESIRVIAPECEL
jgi:hypothetical protein